MPIFAVGIVFVIKVVNNSFDLFESLHYKVLACCKTASRFFTGDLFYEENIHTHWISKDSPPPPPGKSASINALKFSWQFAFEETNFGFWRRSGSSGCACLCKSSFGLRINSDHQLSLSAHLSLAVTKPVILTSLTSPNSSSIWDCCSKLWFSPTQPLPPTKSSHYLYFHGNKSIYNMEHLSSVLFFRGSMAAMMASSKTVLRPAWVTAEQSRKVTRLSSLTTFSACLCDTCLCLHRLYLWWWCWTF